MDDNQPEGLSEASLRLTSGRQSFHQPQSDPTPTPQEAAPMPTQPDSPPSVA